MRRPSKPLVAAVLLSFSVYLLPLVGPHSLTLLGPGLLKELTRDTNRNPAWIAADLGLALLLQAAAMAVLYRLFRKPNLIAGIVAVLAIPVFIGFAEVSYLVAIPSMFLIERDTMNESGNWPVACSAANATLISVPMSQMRSRQDTPSFPVQSSDGRYHMMRFSDCSLQPLSLPQPTLQPGGQRVDFTVGITYFVSDAGVLFYKLPVGTTKMEWAVLKSAGAPIPLDIPSPIPVLSSDAESIGWVELSEGSGPRPSHAFVRRIDSQRPFADIDLSAYGLSNQYTLIGLDARDRQALLAKNEYSNYVFLTVDFAGRELSSTNPDGIRLQPQTFLKLPDGWIGWDAYQEREAYRVRWSLAAAGQGSHRVTLGRGITAVATNPSGSLIAVSVTTHLNIGNAPDAVYILRTSDASEVFRKYLPRYSRSNVVFPSDDRFAYSADGTTIVLHVPQG
jgi:hypothetical protein